MFGKSVASNVRYPNHRDIPKLVWTEKVCAQMTKDCLQLRLGEAKATSWESLTIQHLSCYRNPSAAHHPQALQAHRVVCIRGWCKHKPIRKCVCVDLRMGSCTPVCVNLKGVAARGIHT